MHTPDTRQGPHTEDAATNPRNVRTFSSAAYLEKLMGELDRAAICARIKSARIAAGLTQQELGDALDPPAHFRTVQTWESLKQARVPWRRLGQIAEVTGVTKEWLLHGEELARPYFLEDPPEGADSVIALREELAAEVDRLRSLNDALEEELARPRQARKTRGRA